MKKWKIKYQRGSDICIMTLESEEDEFQYRFYMMHPDCDIISIEEVKT